MTKEEFYKLTDILNSDVLGNFMHGGEASEVIAQFEEAVEKSGILKEEFDVCKFCDEKNTCVDPCCVKLVEKQEPTTDIDFEQELYKAFGQVKDFAIGMQIAKRFYEMGKQHQEPVSEGLEEAADKYESEQQEKYKDRDNHDFDNYRDGFVDGLTHTYEAFMSGAMWQKEHLWKPADGDDLPEIDREVIAILDYDFGHYKVVYAHRPNPNGWNGTNIDTGEKEYFEPEIYDKGGWNQPHVLYWLDTRLPYEENKIDKEIEL